MTSPLISLVGVGALAIWVACKKEARDCIRHVVHNFWQYLWPLNEDHPQRTALPDTNTGTDIEANLIRSPGAASSLSNSPIDAIESGIGSQMSGFIVGLHPATHRIVITPSPRLTDRFIEMVPIHIAGQVEISVASSARTRKKVQDTMKNLREIDDSTLSSDKKAVGAPAEPDDSGKVDGKEEKTEESAQSGNQIARLESFESVSSGLFFDADTSPRGRVGSSGSGGGGCPAHSDPREDRSSISAPIPHELQSSHQTMNVLERVSISTEESPFSLDQVIISSDY